MSSRQLIALLGSIVLFVGVFMPIVSVPIMGNLNYFQNGKGDGVIVLALATVSAIAAARQRYQVLWLTGGGCLAVLGFTFVNLQSSLAAAKGEMEQQLAGNPFRGLADAALGSIQLQWGWALLIVGAVLLVVAAAMKGRPELAVECPHCGGVLPLNQAVCNHCGNRISWIQGKARRPSRPVE